MTNALNKVILIGHLGHEPDAHFTPQGTKVARFSLATREIWNREEERCEHTEWHKIIAWKNLADLTEEYLTKGSKIFMEGRLRTKKWYDNKGVSRSKTEITMDKMLMLDPPPENFAPDTEDEQDEDELPI